MTSPTGNAPTARLLVYASGNLACIKIIGRANFTSSIDFKLLLTGLLDKGCTTVQLDLAECVLMDSTFLGVLAGFGLRMSVSRDDHSDGCSIELLNANARVSELLENLGVLHLFKVATGPVVSPGQLESAAPQAASPTHEEVTRNCLEAHETLMQVSPANIARFKDVAQFLAEDLKKHQSGS